MASEKITVAIIDDHSVVRMGLKYVLEMDGGIAVVGDTSDGSEAVRFVRETKPDILLLDIYMPGKNGLNVLEDVLLAFPDQKVIMLTTSAADNDAYQALELGARGYLLKDRDAADLPRAIRAVADGEKFVPEEIRELVRQRQMTSAPTLREQAVLEGLVAGKGNEEIAEELGVTINCVKLHVRHLFEKFGVSTRVAVATTALKRGFVHLSKAVAVAVCLGVFESVSAAVDETTEETRAAPVASGSIGGIVAKVREGAAEVRVAGVRGLVSHVSVLRPRTFVLTHADRTYRSGVPVVLSGDGPLPEAGDEVYIRGLAVPQGGDVLVQADGYAKSGRGRLSFPRSPRLVDYRKGLLDYRTITVEGPIVQVSVEEEEDGEEPYTVLAVARSKTPFHIRVPGVLHEPAYIGRTIRAKGCVFPLLDEQGRRMASVVELESASDVRLLDVPWGEIALWCASAFLSLALAVVFVAWRRAQRGRIALEAVTAERKRMAADLHDTIEQHLACVKLLITGALNNDHLGDRTRLTLAHACEVLARAKLEVRDAVLGLRSDESQAKTPDQTVREIARSLAQGNAVDVRVRLRGLPDTLAQGRHHDLALIVREAVTNAIKHGHPRRILFLADPVSRDASVRGAVLRILNDGEKFDACHALGPETGHFGLAGMRERAVRSGFALRFVDVGRWCGIELDVTSEKPDFGMRGNSRG